MEEGISYSEPQLAAADGAAGEAAGSLNSTKRFGYDYYDLSNGTEFNNE